MPIYTITEEGLDPVILTALSDPDNEFSENLVASSNNCCCGYLACKIICCVPKFEPGQCGGCGEDVGLYGGCCTDDEGDECCGTHWKTREGGCTLSTDGRSLKRFPDGSFGPSGADNVNVGGHPELCEGFSWGVANDTCPEAYLEEILASLP